MKTKYPIVQFSDDKQEVCCCYVLPVSEGSDLIFSHDMSVYNTYQIIDLAENVFFQDAIDDGFVNLHLVNLSDFFAPGDCFRIKTLGASENYYSNIFKYIGCDTDNTHVFEYWDTDDVSRQRIRLSCVIDNPQSKTEKSDYTDSNGVNISLSKTRRKEYSLTTDFYPESVHDAIKEIFLYPNLLVDDEQMYESGDYDISWDEEDENDNARATTKLSEQDINRYSIC